MSEPKRVHVALTIHLDLPMPEDGTLPRQCQPDSWRWDQILDLDRGDRATRIDIRIGHTARMVAVACDLYYALRMRRDHDVMEPEVFAAAYTEGNDVERVRAATHTALALADREWSDQ